MKTPSADWLAVRLDYDPESGALTWRHRPIEDFPNEQTQRAWNGKNAGKAAGTVSRYGYITINFRGSRYRAHRLVWLMSYRTWPVGEIDHINGNGGDNRLANLRDVSHAANAQNRRTARSDSSTGVPGVFREGKRWRARIWVEGKPRNLGTYECPELARHAYIEAKRQLHPGCTF